MLEAVARASDAAEIFEKILLGFPSAATDARATAAKIELYLEALPPCPLWALKEAKRRWARGQCGDHNYDFAPSPHALRDAVIEVLRPYRDVLDRLDLLLADMDLDATLKALGTAYNAPPASLPRPVAPNQNALTDGRERAAGDPVGSDGHGERVKADLARRAADRGELPPPPPIVTP